MVELYKIRFLKDTELKKVGEIGEATKNSAESFVNNGYAEYVEEPKEVTKVPPTPTQASIPEQLQQRDIRFVLLGEGGTEKGKIPFEKDWQNNGYEFDDPKLLKHIEKGFNYGVIGGPGRIRILDVDNKELAKEFIDKTSTYTVQTGSGGCHLYFISDYETNHVLINELGELRSKNYQVVSAPCLHPNKNYYKVIKDVPIVEIKEEELLKILKPYLREENTTEQKKEGGDPTRSALEYRKIIALLRKGKERKEIYKIMEAYSKWATAHDKYKSTTFEKAEDFVLTEQENKRVGIKEKVEISPRVKKLLAEGKLWDYIIKEELDKKHKGDEDSKEVVLLCMIGRKIINKKTYSFNVLVLVPSSSGKDHLLSSCLKLISKEDVEIYGRITAKSLNYLHSLKNEPDYDYNGKIIYLKEITEEILNNEVMKEFTSGDEEISTVAVTNQKDGRADLIQIKGHPNVFATTATSIPSDEIRNRYNIITLDISEEQTYRTFISGEEKYDKDITNFLEGLKPYEVFIPQDLFNFVVGIFPKNKIRYRRDFQKLLDYIKSITLFNQDIREKTEKGLLVATAEDYNKAKDVFVNAFSTCSDIPLKDIDTRIIKILEKDGKPMAAKSILNELGGIITLQNLYPHLRNLISKEILNELSDRDAFNNVVTNYVLSLEFIDKKPFTLPKYEIGTNGINGNNGNNGSNGSNDKSVEKKVLFNYGGSNNTINTINTINRYPFSDDLIKKSGLDPEMVARVTTQVINEQKEAQNERNDKRNL